MTNFWGLQRKCLMNWTLRNLSKKKRDFLSIEKTKKAVQLTMITT